MMTLNIAAGCIAAFALVMYVLFDGFDLGVGSLLLWRTKETERDWMVLAIAPTWDGNETWLILAGVCLLGAFPLAYSVVLPAVYLPLIFMLMSLGARGVSFEFRFQTTEWRPFWDRAFGLGSIIAAFCQGVILGTLLQGISIREHAFAGGVLDFLSPFSLSTGLTVVVAYGVLGAGWLYYKTEGSLQAFAARSLRIGVPLLAVLATLTFAAATALQPEIAETWGRFGWLFLAFGLGFYTALYRAVTRIGRRSDREPLICLLGAYLWVFAGVILCVYPKIIPFRMTLEAASSPPDSQRFFVVGAICVIPVILAYTAFSYRVFRGKIGGGTSL